MSKILIFAPNYFPGYMSGGIARTILNTVEWIGDEFDFLIVTRDRDLGSVSPYTKIHRGQWELVGKSKVRYLAPDELTLTALAQLVNETDHDVLHLNSFFDSVFSIKLLLLLRLKKINSRRVVMSPRGEFVEGPLRIKYWKKWLYIKISLMIGFYRDVYWHASSPHEAMGIAKAMQISPSSVYSAIDLPIRCSEEFDAGFPQGAELKVVFLSRLTREKNLDGALRILQHVLKPMQLDIIGPKEDLQYWRECESLLAKLPPHVKARYLGPISPEKVFESFAQYDLFFFPTHGENYGHVIAESISVGTRVLVSQATPWRNLSDDGVGWDIDLSNYSLFARVLDEVASQSAEERIALRENVRRAALIRLLNPEALEHNRLLYSLK